jgi:hypothetical protein
MNEQLSCHHFGSIGGVRGLLVLPLLSCLVAPFEEDDANAAATSSSGKKEGR